jgi:isochorismate pyruvate lyase
MRVNGRLFQPCPGWHGLISVDQQGTQGKLYNEDEPDVTAKQPAECQTKDDVRVEIDRIDQALLQLFAERHRYVTRMAEIKTDPHEARDPTRIEAVIKKVRDRSLALDLDEDQAELVWRTLIDWNINYEKGIIAARRRAQ